MTRTLWTILLVWTMYATNGTIEHRLVPDFDTEWACRTSARAALREQRVWEASANLWAVARGLPPLLASPWRYECRESR